MKKNKTSPTYIPRSLKPALMEALSDTPVVCLLGPRQCGKSTLAQQCEPNRHYISLDDQNYLQLALNDPQGFIDQLPDRTTIDEIQRAPELTLAIKRRVDHNRIAGGFLLTGSANLLQLPRLADSLAGRMECLFLQPFTASEVLGIKGNFLSHWMNDGVKPTLGIARPPAPSKLPVMLAAGGYPESVSRTPHRARAWQKQYIKALIERDIHDIADIKNSADITRLLDYIAINTAQLLNVSAISKTLGHSRATIESYIGILEKLFLTRRLPAWHSNRSKRLIKAPKIHFCDSGLASMLSQLREEQWNEERTRFGHLLESFIIQQLMSMGSWMDEIPHFFHYRDKDQVEVDLIIETQGQVWGVEVKAAASVRASDAKGLVRFANVAGKRFQGGIVFYDGHSTIILCKKNNILAVPLSKLWETQGDT